MPDKKSHHRDSSHKGSPVVSSHKGTESAKDAKTAKTIESNKSGGSSTRAGMSGR